MFHRLRVSNIRNKLSLDNLYHVDGKHNVADTGTRPDLLTADQLMPDSEWIRGKAWMKLSEEEAVQSGIIKNTNDIILDNDAKKIFKEGIIIEDAMGFMTIYQSSRIVSHKLPPGFVITRTSLTYKACSQ